MRPLTSWLPLHPQGPLVFSNCPTSGQPALLPGLELWRPSFSCVAPHPSGTASHSSPPPFLVAHQLTAFQKAEKLFSSEPLGDCSPSELLSEMLELVYPGEERSCLLAMPFLRQVPAAVRLQLTEDDHEDIWSTRLTGAPPLSTAISSSYQFSPPPPMTVRTVRSSLTSPSLLWAPTGVATPPSSPEAARTTQGGIGGQCPQCSSNSSQQEPSQTQLAKQSGLCRNHFIFIDKTYNYSGNCSWSGK